jgi:signal peptidase I
MIAARCFEHAEVGRPMTRQDTATWAPPRTRPERQAGRIVFWLLVGLAFAALATSVAIPVVTIQPYVEQSTSMQNTLAPGDRLFAVPGDSLRLGDVIIFRAPARLSKTRALVVKRVIGLPGDHVACCDSRGRITVDGRALDETYLYPGDPPSRLRFSATVGKGRVWVMGDHRNISVDSREWGAIPASAIVGRVLFVAHGSSIAALRTPQTFVADGLAPKDTRLDFYLRLALLALASTAVLLVLAIIGITRFVVRRRRARRAPPSRGAQPSGETQPPGVTEPSGETQPPGGAQSPAPLEPMWGVYRGLPDPPDGPALPS